MSGDYHNLVTTLFLVNKLITIFSQGCYKIVAVRKLLQHFLVNNPVTILSQLCNFYTSYFSLVLTMKIGMCDLVIFCLV